MNSKIIRLPQEIAEKIAAGEVIERPFSVVKELVENSLDAGATKIEIFVEEGGRRLIRIQDDGGGMTPEEMRVALERHATSKICSLDDLFSISTLGFRGEALPSVASISHFTLKSRSKQSDRISGYEIHLEGGKILHEHETGHPVGTTIEVKDLFFNTPVRLKFLKSHETEWGHIDDYLTAMALAYPEVQFVAHHNGKEKFRYTQREALPRLTEILGSEVTEGFYPLLEERGELRLEGFLAHPNLSRSQASSMYVFLNRRLIRDRLLNHAVMAGYRHLLMKDQYPQVVLFLQVPPHLVDVNVHPTKREVRFVKPNEIHEFVVQAIGKSLAREPWKRGGEERGVRSEVKERTMVSDQEVFNLNSSPLTPHPSPSPPLTPHSSPSQWFSSNFQPIQEGTPFTRVGRLPFSSLSVIGQLKGTYILCQTEEHFVILDQHAAHERIGFEQLRTAYQSGSIPTQRLLVPETVEVTERQREAIQPYLFSLEKFGFEIEEFGPTTLVVKGVPHLLGTIDSARLINDLIHDLESHGSSTRIEDRLDEIFALMACHRQIRAGDHLELREMQELVNELDEGAYSYHCPHGRPVMVQITFREIEKWFKRIL
jgi:DNA mismatch repair protein MutL